VARDRQRAKRRQAERRAARLRDERSDRRARSQPDGAGEPPAGGARRTAAPPSDRGQGTPAGAGPEPDPAAEARIAAAAPPEEAGRSDTVVEAPPDAPSLATDGEAPAREGAVGQPERERGRVAAFLAAVVAELRRVQWPTRRTLVTLTGVVLGFVVIMGAYLGGLDWVFSQLVQALL
jgi:preprotein translocase subunit SecE